MAVESRLFHIMPRPTEAAPALIYKEGEDIILDGEEFDPAAGAVQTVYSRSVTLTDAQIKALPTTPVTVIAAQGAGIHTLVHGVLFVASFGGGAYTNLAASPGFEVVWDATNNYISASVPTGGSDMFDADSITSYCPAYVQISEGVSSPTGLARAAGEFGQTVNVTVDVGAANGGNGNFTGGHADNTLKVTVFYSPITI